MKHMTQNLPRLCEGEALHPTCDIERVLIRKLLLTQISEK